MVCFLALTLLEQELLVLLDLILPYHDWLEFLVLLSQQDFTVVAPANYLELRVAAGDVSYDF